MQDDSTAALLEGDDADVKALMRLLTYAVAEANNLGLDDCAELIRRAAGEIEQQVGGVAFDPTIIGSSRMH